MQLLYVRPPGPGWAPLDALASLSAHLLDADLEIVQLSPLGKLVREGLGRLPRRRGGESCLIIAPSPQHLRALAGAGVPWRGHSVVAAWVIDSFWPERAPAIARGRGWIDHYFITDAEFVPAWKALTKSDVTWLPWGADVLGSGCGSPDRPVDLQRMGRQPESWDDDRALTERFALAGLTYHGRPSFHPNPIDNQTEVMRRYRAAKFTVSFTNRLSPASYTHPTHEYLTARWTDALACGSSVVGVPPRCRATEELLWPEALVVLDDTDPGHALPRVKSAVEAWTPDLAALNHRMALSRLDWRWRLAELSAAFGQSFPRLDADLATLRSALAQPA